MVLDDWFSNIHLFVRWLHVFVGIIWIGFLYFFNFVNVPLQAALDDAGKKAVNPKLLPRTLWWFRWGAMLTFLAGLTLYVMIYMYTPGGGFGPNSVAKDLIGNMTGRHIWILLGMLLGTIMWFNVWFIIWPIQKKLLQGKIPADQIAGARKKAGLASRANTYLSGPMLYGMLAAGHYSAFSWPTFIIFALAAIAIIFHAIQRSGKVGTSV